MPRTGRERQKAGKLLLMAGEMEGLGVMTKGNKVSFLGNENILVLIMATDTQHYILNGIELYTFNE